MYNIKKNTCKLKVFNSLNFSYYYRKQRTVAAIHLKLLQSQYLDLIAMILIGFVIFKKYATSYMFTIMTFANCKLLFQGPTRR